MHWLSWFTIGVTFLAVTGVLPRLFMRGIDSDPAAYGFVQQIIVAVVLAIYAVVFGAFDIAPLSGFVPNLIAMSLLYTFGNIALFTAYKHGEASIVSLLFASRSIWTVCTAVIFLAEPFGWQLAAGTALVLAGIAVISIEKTATVSRKSLIAGLLAGLFFGLAFTNDAYIISRSQVDVPSFLVIAFTLPAITTLLVSPKSIPALKTFGKRAVLGPVLINSILYAVASLGLFTAYATGGNASQLGPMAQVSLVIALALSFLFLNERSRMLRKITGGLLVVLGTVLLA